MGLPDGGDPLQVWGRRAGVLWVRHRAVREALALWGPVPCQGTRHFLLGQNEPREPGFHPNVALQGARGVGAPSLPALVEDPGRTRSSSPSYPEPESGCQAFLAFPGVSQSARLPPRKTTGSLNSRATKLLPARALPPWSPGALCSPGLQSSSPLFPLPLRDPLTTPCQGPPPSSLPRVSASRWTPPRAPRLSGPSPAPVGIYFRLKSAGVGQGLAGLPGRIRGDSVRYTTKGVPWLASLRGSGVTALWNVGGPWLSL